MTTAQASPGTTPVASIAVPLALLALIAATQTMDPGIANIGLVEATRSLPIPSSQVALAATIATMAASATVVSFGYIADRIGRRRLLMIALLLSVVGELTSAFAIDSTMYLAGRALAGAGLGAVFSASFAYVKVVAGPDRVNAALGTWTAMFTLFAVIGQLLGGVFIHTLSWRVGLLIVPTVCLVALLVVPRLLPVVSPADSDKADVVGQVLLFLGVTGTLYGIANMANSLSSPATVISLVGGIACFAAFALVELRVPHAVFPIRLFAKRAFIAAVLTGLLWNFIQGASVLQLSNLWQYVTGWGSEKVSFGQLPMAAATVVGAYLVGKWLANRVAVSRIFLLGGVVAFAGTVTLVLVKVDSGFLVFLPALLMIGFAIPCFSVPSAALFVAEAPPKYFGAVTSSRLMVGQFGYSLATALSSVLVNGLTQGGVAKKLQEAGVPDSQIGSAWTSVNDYVRFGASEPATEAGRSALSDAGSSYVTAFSTTLLIVGVVVLVIAIASAVLVKGMKGVQAPDPTIVNQEA